MSDWPNMGFDPLVTIHPYSLESIGSAIISNGGGGLSSAASATYPVANQAVYVPFLVGRPILVLQMFTYNGITASGNLDVGVYDSQQNKLFSIGSTAQTGTSSIQTFNTTDTVLPPGLYYMALAMNGTTGTFIRGRVNAGTAASAAAVGVATQTTAFALPATAAMVTCASDYIPIFGLTIRSVV